MLLSLLVVAAIVVVGVLVSGYELRDLTRVGQPRNVLDDNGRQVELPYAQGPSTRRLPEVPVTTTGEYAFSVIDDTGPVRFDPCRTVRWVLAVEDMPVFAEPVVFAAIAELQLRTGLEFEYLGTTDEVPDFERPMFQDRYGDYYAPLIIGWSSAEQNPDLEGPVAGIGGSNAIQGSHGEQRYLRGGVVVLDGPDLGLYLASSSGEAQVQAIIMHELAHVVGLAHVSDSTELMYETNNRQTTWGPGDLQGLALAGAGPCE
jgi:hypothetical protein